MFGTRAPSVAARWGTGAAATSAAQANSLAQPGASPTALIRAERLASNALSREPASVPAVRALGQIAGLRGDLPRASRIFRYSEQLSRRDLLTQMWLIEERVRRDDIPGALTHYDRALRTVGSARAILFPVMISAMSTPEIARAAQRLMAARTAWGPDFLSVMAQTPTASSDALGQLTVSAQLRPNLAAERDALVAVLGRLVASGRYAAAQTVWTRALGVRDQPAVRGGDFETEPLLPPFDWSFANTGNLSATREPGGTGTVLVLRAVNGGSGEFARQLLTLQPGGYRIALITSGASADRIARAAVAVTCASGNGELLRLPLSTTARARLESSFTVPPGCEAQMLTIVAPAGLGDGNASVVLDDLAITPVRR